MAKTKQPSTTTSPAGNNTEDVSLPKRVVASKVRMSDPGFLKSKDTIIPDFEGTFINASIKDLRNVPTVPAIRALTRFNGIFSTTVHSYIQMAMSGYKVTSYVAGTHQFDPVATAAAQSVIIAMDTLYDYTVGYSDKQSMDGLIETLLKECLQAGGCSMELVLNRWRLPERMLAVPITSLHWTSRGDGTIFPQQTSTNGNLALNMEKHVSNMPLAAYVDLDIPTFFYASVAQQSNSIMPRSPLEGALQMIFVYTEFLEDMTRVMRKSGHSRLVVTIVQENVRKMATPDIQNDPVKLRNFFEQTRLDLQRVISGLDPEDALVMYDSAKADILKNQHGEKTDYSALLATLGGMMAASLKSMASVLGLSAGSQNLATTEAMVYLKLVRSIQVPVETVMSRAITLAVRLLTGQDSYCKFEFAPINLRPESELSAHKAVMFQDALYKLSLGLYTDEEFAHLVGTGPRAPNAPKLSGTMFMDPNNSSAAPKNMGLNDNGQQRNLNEGTSKGTPPSEPGGKPVNG